MFYQWLFYVSTFYCTVVCVSGENKVAVALLKAEGISGEITFTEADGGVRVTGEIIGLPAGNYGFHIHELGNVSTCDATGAHFNPDGNTHGGREHAQRHVGDLGNVQFVGNDTAVATVDFLDRVISLAGRNSILGRALVLHEREDDLGLGGNATSLATGNAGARVACGVVGIAAPAGPWNAGLTVAPSAAITALPIFFVLLSFFIETLYKYQITYDIVGYAKSYARF